MSEPSVSMTKPELLSQIGKERWRLDMLLAALNPEQLLQPGACGDWTIKDIMAHISAWEQWMIRWTEMHLAGQLPDVPLPWDVDRMNAETYTRLKDKPLRSVQREFHRSYQAALNLVGRLSEEQLHSVYDETWPMGPLWTGVAANTSWHYREHREGLEKWLQK
ncbi:MAG: ClbS/DfsB family four-helix bundle protein [Anaerolineales bacterium]